MRKNIEVELLVTPDYPHALEASSWVKRTIQPLAPELAPKTTLVRSMEEAESLGFTGSPTIRVDGRDVETNGPVEPSLDPRLYDGEVRPPDWMLEATLLRALGPEHVLFMCVANSARSQMAEGLARDLAPSAIRVSSAGSEPSRVRPQAIRALEEVGIDIRSHWSKGADEIERPVSAVITLCAEEVCPVWVEDSIRLHWGLPDPAGAGSDEDEEMYAFRSARDELRRRLGTLFAE